MRRSEMIGQIADALAKAQAKIKAAAKDANNPHFKAAYADLASVRAACNEQLAGHGIAVIQTPEADGARVTVTTLLAHSSGEWIEGALTLTARDATPQSVGSAITYGRRYGLASMVGVAPDDDDGEAAQPAGKRQPRREPAQASAPTEATSQERPVGVISDAQRKRLWTIASNAGWTKDDMAKLLKDHFGFESSKDITIARYDQIVESVENGTLPQGKAS